VVTTLYRSEPYILEFHGRISAAAAKLTDEFELIFVNDGSPDHSLRTVLGLAEQDPRIVVVDLSRNFGHHKAIMAGLAQARGERVFLIDSDLEEDPALLLEFTDQLDKSGADVVFGVQAKRTGGLFRRLTGAAFYKFFYLVSDIHIPANLLTVRLMSARYVRSLLLHTEKEFAISGLWQLTGFLQVPVLLMRKDRGSTSYSAGRRFAMLVNTVSAFSIRPLTFSFFLGLTVMILCGLAAVSLVIASLSGESYLSGWPSVVISVWSVSGLTIFCLGVLGKYLGTIFMEVKKRPLTVVKAYYGFPNRPSELPGHADAGSVAKLPAG
jgi:putative glycosyltransferase